MVLAIAALLFQFSPAVQAPLPSVSDSAADYTEAAPKLYAADLPDAGPSPASFASVSTGSGSAIAKPLDSATASGDSSESSSGGLNPASLHTALQNSPSLAMIRVPESDSAPLRTISVESLPSRHQWIALSIAQHAAAAFDAYSTRDAISRGAVEQDPLMRPFASSSAIYAAIQACPVALDFAARHMQRSDNNFIRRSWWVPQTISTGMFLFSGAHNLRVANRLQ
jgi:hypothetical protein